jgi:hypothetical protein
VFLDMAEKKAEMTVLEAGHKGGSTTKERYGEGFYEEIGKKGGKIGGKKGGTTTKERYGEGFYEEIRKGAEGPRRSTWQAATETSRARPQHKPQTSREIKLAMV